MLTLVKILPALTSVTLYQKRYISKVNKIYIERIGQSKHDKEFAFWSGFIISSIVPYSIFIGSISSIYTERHMLKTIDQMVFLKQADFVKQSFHQRYFLAHNGANGMFFGSLFFTMLGITSCVVGLKGVGFW
jgi:hypothetical protein